jgi:hypothetical protein
MAHQDGLGNNGTEPAGLTKSEDGHYRVQKESENVAQAPDGIKLKKLRNSGHLRNSPTTREAPAANAWFPQFCWTVRLLKLVIRTATLE